MVLPGIMEFFVVITSSMRAIIVAVFLFLNANSLTTLFKHKRYCLHRLTAGTVYLGNVVYLLTWIPFVVYGLLNGQTLVVSSTTYCVWQNVVTHGFGMLLLGVLGVRSVELFRLRTFSNRHPMTPSQAGITLFLICFLPQILLCLTLMYWSKYSPDNYSVNFQFLDDVTRLQWSTNETEYRVGFLICQQELTPHTVRAYYYQFQAVVLPMAVVIFVCTVGRCLCKRQGSHIGSKTRTALPTLRPLPHNPSDGPPGACSLVCDRRLVVIDLIMCSNFAWQVFIRPLMVVHSLHVSDSMMMTPATFLDFGSHLVLTLSAVFAPSIVLNGSRQDKGSTPFFIRLPESNDAVITKYQKSTPEEQERLLAA